MLPLEAFDTPTQRKILRVLAEKHRQYTIDELAELCHRSNSTVSRALRGAARYPFVDVGRVSGTKQKLYGLDTASEYADPIRQLFQIERRRERRGGTIPVDVWNLLEDVTVSLDEKIDQFVELFLFGSYATGEYYAGSDIDLVLVSRSAGEDLTARALDVLEDTVPDGYETQLFVAELTESEPDSDRQAAEVAARKRVSVADSDPLIALWGDRS